MDRLLYALVEEGLSARDCLKAGFSEELVQTIVSRVKKYRFKSTQPLVGSVGQFSLADLEKLPAFS